MDRQKQSIVIVLVFFVSLFCNRLGAQPESSVFGSLKNAGKAGSLMTIAKDFMQNFSELDYATSKQLVIALPATGYELVYHWGFIGSGDLFSPLPQVKAQFRLAQTVGIPADSANALADLGKVMVQNELFKKSKQVPLVKWLSDSEISPIKLLIVKTILLIKSNAALGTEFIKYELFRLLFRLSLVDDITLFDESKALTSFIPETIKLALDEMSPEIAKTIDEVWATVTSSRNLVSDMHGHNGLSCITAYIFNDASLAKSCYESMLSQPHYDICQALEQSICKTGLSLLTYEDLISLSLLTAPHQALNPSLKLVGKKEFGLVNLESSSSVLPAAVLARLKQEASSLEEKYLMAFTVTDVDGRTWIVCKGGRLDAVQTAKIFAAALIMTFKDYVKARKAVMASSSQQAIAYRAALQARELERVKKMNFLSSEYGKTSAIRLEQALAALEAQGNEQMNAYALQQQEALEIELIALKAQFKKKKEDLARLKAAAQRAQGDALRIANITVANAQKACQDLEQKMVAVQQARDAAYNISQVNNAELDATVAQKRADYVGHISSLRALLRKDQTLDVAQQQEIQKCIAQLEQSMQQLSTKDQSAQASEHLEKVLFKRSQAAQIYTNEERAMRDELDLLNAGLFKIADPALRMAKTIEFSSLKKEFELYIDSLQQEAVKIKDENKKLVELEASKRAIAGSKADKVDQQVLERIQALEYEVGYLLHTGAASWLRGLLHASTDVKAFMDDLQAGSLEEFKQVKERFFSKLKFIAQHSDHVAENLLLYRYLVGLVLPEFLPVFDHCTNKLA